MRVSRDNEIVFVFEIKLFVRRSPEELLFTVKSKFTKFLEVLAVERLQLNSKFFF